MVFFFPFCCCGGEGGEGEGGSAAAVVAAAVAVLLGSDIVVSPMGEADVVGFFVSRAARRASILLVVWLSEFNPILPVITILLLRWGGEAAT